MELFNKIIEKIKLLKWKRIIIPATILFITIYLNQIFFVVKELAGPLIKGGVNVSISDRIYFLTLVAIIWYAYETKLLRKATVGRPVISIIKNVSDTIEIRNDGSNIAYNIKVYFLYGGFTRHKIEISILGKGLMYKIGIESAEIKIDEKNKVKLSSLINSSPPDPNLKVLIYYSDSVENKKPQYEDKWKLDEAVIMSNANEGRFRMTRSRKI